MDPAAAEPTPQPGTTSPVKQTEVAALPLRAPATNAPASDAVVEEPAPASKPPAAATDAPVPASEAPAAAGVSAKEEPTGNKPAAVAGGAAVVSDGDVAKAVRAIVAAGDLATLTKKTIREKLVAQGIDGGSFKAVINATVATIVAEQQSAEASDSSDSDGGEDVSDDGDDDDADKSEDEEEEGKAAPAAKPKQKGVFGRELLCSPALAEVVDADMLTRSEATKRIWAYVKEHNLPRKGKNVQLDDKLSAALKRKTVSFGTLAKALSGCMHDPHFMVGYDADGNYVGEDESPKPKAKAKAKAKLKAKSKPKPKAATKKKAATSAAAPAKKRRTKK